MPPRSWENHQWQQRWDDGKRGGRDPDPFEELDAAIRRVARSEKEKRSRLEKENEHLRKRLRDENGSHERYRKTQEELTRKTQEVAILETKLSHSERNSAKKVRCILESVWGELSAIGSVSDAEGETPQGAVPQQETPKAPEDVAGSAVVLPEGPGEAAPGTPTETADDMPAPVRDTLKDESQGASPSL